MKYSFSAVLLASALGAVALPANASPIGPTHHPAQLQLGTHAGGIPLEIAAGYGRDPADQEVDNAATPAIHGDDGLVTPGMPNNPIAADEVQDHRPNVIGHDVDRPDVDRPDVDRPDVDRPTIERPEMDR